MTGKVAALDHELRNDTVEGRTLVALALWAPAELTEVLNSLGNNIFEELEDDAAPLCCYHEKKTWSAGSFQLMTDNGLPGWKNDN